ncbi:hypothetical protein CsSME_00006618 [Camellia sinensis var. sinensis]
MRFSHFSTPILAYSIFLQCCFCTSASDYATPHSLVDNIAINCGASGKSIAVDGREWIGDIGFSNLAPFKSTSSKSNHRASDTVSPVPYMTARISSSQFSYTLQLSPGQKFIRLHFYPTSYSGFGRSKAFFTVKAGPYTLLSNFSASLAADALGLNSFAREFCVNVEENRALTITFSPSPASYAFINGIEIVSIPVGLYYTDSGVYVVGQKYKTYIKNNTALETSHRLNIGGGLILSVEDSGMFRQWFDDTNYLLESSGLLPVTGTVAVKFMNAAPPKLYQTAWSMDPNMQTNQLYSFTWKLPVDLGFRYLVRLHFCDLEYRAKESHYREFSVFINNQMAEAYTDLLRWNAGNGVAMHRDYMVTMEGERIEGKRDVLVVVHHHYELRTTQREVILKGLEVFKLSNPDNNLAGVNPMFLIHAPTTSTPKLRALVFSFGGVNTVATGVVILLSLLNITVYQLRIWGENYGERNISSSSTAKNLCRRFSIHEIQSATNNFDDALVIGHGGFGKVYKGLIDDGATTVAIKRLNLMSNQGPREFWTEVEMLSKLRHIHLVALIGYCKDSQEMILVYEYMAHGTLADHLYKNTREGHSICCLNWEQRLNVCIDAARGLDYLHRGTQPGVIHRDVKTTNILLNEYWVAKISDFGLSKIDTTSQSHTHVSTDVKGTFGYLDPEYFSSHRLTWKTDVYAFGVVLLEALCGRKAVDAELEDEQQHSLALWAKHCIKEGMLDQIIDPTLGGKISSRCLKVFVEVASKCLHKCPNLRPTMFDVVGSLEIALAAQCQRIDPSIKIEEVEVEVEVEVEADYEEDEDFINLRRAEFEEIIGITTLDLGGAVVAQRTQGPMFGQDEGEFQAKRKTNSTFSKLVRGITRRAKGMDMPKEKTENGRSVKRKPLPVIPEEPFRHLSVAQIELATNNFDSASIIDCDGSDIVYEGYLEDGSLVVVKWILKSMFIGCEFWDEIRMLPKLRHPNLVPLVDYFPYKYGVLLVSEFTANESLHDHLYDCETKGYSPLSWNQRLRICIDVARGLQYLHRGWERSIIHPCLQTSKILLAEGWAGKVSDFWLPRRFKDDTYMTSVYAAPEYIYGLLTDKSNVYSFGVVLLEVVSAREEALYLPSLENRPQLSQLEKGGYIDPFLIRTKKMGTASLRIFVEIMESCLQFNWRERPSMGDVVEKLEYALQLQEEFTESAK